jgi:hypothetical protein
VGHVLERENLRITVTDADDLRTRLAEVEVLESADAAGESTADSGEQLHI